MLTLYFAPGTSSFAVHIALHEIGVPFEGKPMSFKNDLRSPAYLALNAEGKVPTLLVDGRPLTEVAAILHYLRSPTSICFGSIGGSPIRSSPRRKPFPISPRIKRA